jgi:hypothetical protein
MEDHMSDTTDEPDVVVDDEPDEPDVDTEPDVEPDPVDDKPKPKDPKAPKPGDDDFVPPTKAEWVRTQAALKKANEDGKRHRLRNKELEDQGRANESEHEKALREAREEGEKRFRTPLVKTATRAALIEGGALAFLQEEKDPESQAAKEKGESRLNRLLKLVDTEALDIDDDGSVAGLDAAVDDLRRDYPEFFQAPAKRLRPRPTAAGREPAPEKPKSAAQRHADRALGKG